MQSPNTRPRLLWLGLLLSLASLGCEEPQGPVREWQPGDHQAPAQPEQATDAPDEATQARVVANLFQSRCGTCHGAGGAGGSGPPLNTATIASQSDEDLGQIIAGGRGEMPGFSDQLNPLGITALVGHLRTLTPQVVEDQPQTSDGAPQPNAAPQPNGAPAQDEDTEAAIPEPSEATAPAEVDTRPTPSEEVEAPRAATTPSADAETRVP